MRIEIEEIRRILNEKPLFIRDALDPSEVMYSPRLNKYVERGLHSAVIQTENNEYYRSTMPHDSSFYKECIPLSDLERSLKKNQVYLFLNDD